MLTELLTEMFSVIFMNHSSVEIILSCRCAGPSSGCSRMASPDSALQMEKKTKRLILSVIKQCSDPDSDAPTSKGMINWLSMPACHP